MRLTQRVYHHACAKQDEGCNHEKLPAEEFKNKAAYQNKNGGGCIAKLSKPVCKRLSLLMIHVVIILIPQQSSDDALHVGIDQRYRKRDEKQCKNIQTAHFGLCLDSIVHFSFLYIWRLQYLTGGLITNNTLGGGTASIYFDAATAYAFSLV